MITSKEAIHFSPNIGKTVHFPINHYSKLHFITSNSKQFSVQYHIHISHQNLTEPLVL